MEIEGNRMNIKNLFPSTKTNQIKRSHMVPFLFPDIDQLRLALKATGDENPAHLIISRSLFRILIEEIPAFNRPKDPPVPDEVIDPVRGREKGIVRQVIQDYKASPEFLSRREELYRKALREYISRNQEIIERNRKKAIDFLANEKEQRAKIESVAEEISAIRAKIRSLKARYDKEYGCEIEQV